MPPASPDTAAPPPLLTIAIPTFNRAQHLQELLQVLEPQIAQFPQVELLLSDNASSDATPELIAACRQRLLAAGARCRSQRHEQNLGADANFASCFRAARGRFFWICGDDDLIVPGALAEVLSHLQTRDGTPADIDILYATSFGFRDNFLAERRQDPFGRRFHTVRDPRRLAMITNIMFTFISGIIVNKQRLDSLPHEDPQAFVGTNLVQLSWALPLLLHHRKSIVLWSRPVAARIGNANGYSLGHVFGNHLAGNVARLLPGRPDLSAPILNFALRRWFPSVLIEVRSAGNATLQLDEAHTELRRAFGRNPLYWLFTYPALQWPLPLARLYTRLTAALDKLFYLAFLPGIWRKQS